ncbi:MAG: NADH-quinone oxidoreductase subunit H [Candidatus Omnitrophica bacterium]|nr:NADH-quinone oxidoreductase subunit H [Candidatus Omnitrophota bacterium]
MLKELFYILIFPGLLFVSFFGLAAEYIDRKLYARLQNRVGPPWFQPLADIIKLLGKEDIIPCEANKSMFTLAPVFALTAVVTAFLYIPLWGVNSLFSFSADIIVVLYLLTIPTLAFFIGGWYSTSLFARIGSVRCVTQLFAYEVPLFMSILASTLMANTWSLRELALFYCKNPSYALFNVLGFVVSLIAILGKLEKAPFDIPEAETEIVAGSFTEYSGRLLAILRMTLDVEMVVCASLLALIFLPFGLGLPPIAAFLLFIIKVLFIVGLISLMRTIFARMRMDQMIDFCWKYLVPLALLQVLINLLVKVVLLK